MFKEIKKVIKQSIEEVMAEPMSIELIKKERQQQLELETRKKAAGNNGVAAVDERPARA